MPMLSRRRFLLGLLAGGWAMLAGRIVQAGPAVLNRPWPLKAFAAKKSAEAQALLFGKNKMTESAQIVLDIPDVAEDGAVVPVSVSTTLPNVERIALLSESNPTPLLAEYLLTPNLEAYVATHVKLAASGAVMAIVHTPDGTFIARKKVKVMVGGCG